MFGSQGRWMIRSLDVEIKAENKYSKKKNCLLCFVHQKDFYDGGCSSEHFTLCSGVYCIHRNSCITNKNNKKKQCIFYNPKEIQLQQSQDKFLQMSQFCLSEDRTLALWVTDRAEKESVPRRLTAGFKNNHSVSLWGLGNESPCIRRKERGKKKKRKKTVRTQEQERVYDSILQCSHSTIEYDIIKLKCLF